MNATPQTVSSTPSRAAATPARRDPAGSRTRLTALLGVILLLAAVPAGGAGFRFVTDNDFLADDGDDLYSFGVGLELQRGSYTLALKENGFTDRAAGIRFDETFLTVTRPFAFADGWRGWGEIGVAHVGNGLLGESFQNRFHEVIGADTVRLRYVDDSRVHPTASLGAGRLWQLGRQVELGPYVEVSATPGLKGHALVAAQASWDVRGPLAVRALVGARQSEAWLDALEPRMDGAAAQVEVTLVYRERVALAWSYNAFGTRQEHLAIGYRVGTLDGLARALTR